MLLFFTCTNNQCYTGGDNSDSAIGTFYEGAMTSGYSTDAADAAVQANIAAAGYGR